VEGDKGIISNDCRSWDKRHDNYFVIDRIAVRSEILALIVEQKGEILQRLFRHTIPEITTMDGSVMIGD